MEPELEIMALPNKETLEFYDKVYNWITGGYREPDNKIVYIFSKDVPKEIIELFLKIRDDVELTISENFHVES